MPVLVSEADSETEAFQQALAFSLLLDRLIEFLSQAELIELYERVHRESEALLQ